jgi:hypothetical protein
MIIVRFSFTPNQEAAAMAKQGKIVRQGKITPRGKVVPQRKPQTVRPILKPVPQYPPPPKDKWGQEFNFNKEDMEGETLGAVFAQEVEHYLGHAVEIYGEENPKVTIGQLVAQLELALNCARRLSETLGEKTKLGKVITN